MLNEDRVLTEAEIGVAEGNELMGDFLPHAPNELSDFVVSADDVGDVGAIKKDGKGGYDIYTYYNGKEFYATEDVFVDARHAAINSVVQASQA